ncbi:MAG TPA: hypothetical protein VFZ48_00995 [Candidatus Saccharimonadales bacterium]
MSIICPTVLAETPADFREQMERVAPFATRIQIDLMDGDFAPTKSIAPIQVWWPEELVADIHLMFRQPINHLETLISLEPHMIILHAEAEGDLLGMMRHLQKLDIKAGVALLKDTPVSAAKELIMQADHALLFSGDLGRFGGEADMAVLSKIAELQTLHPDIEIGWDGGANVSNAAQLAQSGVAVINVGGAIQSAANPAQAYRELTQSIK